LTLATDKGQLEIVKFLVEKSADGNFQYYEQYHKIEYYDSGYTALMKASRGGHLETVKYLVEKGANINATHEKSGDTALMLATDKGHLEIVKYLIDNGADINTTDNDDKIEYLMSLK